MQAMIFRGTGWLKIVGRLFDVQAGKILTALSEAERAAIEHEGLPSALNPWKKRE